ncbi:MAG: O-antigen ligase family protein, partial [Proteobacteria bacterium]|nr:O-antigen ligase family protein [Pseudomonadota bacterium]
MQFVNDPPQKFKRTAFDLIATLSILGFIFSGLSVSTNPDHILPLVPEILSLSFFLFLLSMTGGLGFNELNQIEKRIMKVLMAVVVILGIVAFFSVRDSMCWKAGSNLYRWECVLQSTVLLPTAFRQYSTFFVCSILFCLTYLKRTQNPMTQFDSTSLPIWGLGAIIGGELYYVLVGNRVGPLWLGVAEDQFERTGLTGVFTNVSWVWPYLIPSFILSLVLMDFTKKWHRFLGYTTLFLLLGCVSINRQRGFILAAAALVLTYGLFKIIQGVEIGSRWRKFAGSLAISSVGFAILLFHFFAEKVSLFFSFFGYAQNFKTPLSASSQRIELWQFAFKKIVENPFGYGYSSWFRLNQLGFEKKQIGVLFENPHNALIEFLVDFGVIPAIVLVAAVVYVIVAGWRRPLERWKRCLWIYFWVGILIVVMVQEINYIRATFLIWSVFAGSVFRIIFRSTPLSEPSITSEHPKLERPLFRAGCFSLLTAFVVKYLFSFGAYGFEPSSLPYEVERWIGPKAVVKATPSMKGGYVLFPMTIGPVGPEQAVTIGDVQILRPSSKNWFIPVLRKPYTMQSKAVSFESSFLNYTRYISAKIMYPPITFSVPIIWNDGFVFASPTNISCRVEFCRLLLIYDEQSSAILKPLIESSKSSFTW